MTDQLDRAVRALLADLVDGTPSLGPAPLGHHAAGRPSDRRWTALIAAGLLVVAGLGALMFVDRAGQAEPPARLDTTSPAAPQPGVAPPAPVGGPQLNDHWHISYGLYLCNAWYVLRGSLDEADQNGNLTNHKYLANTINSHDDGVIHWHPYTTTSTGQQALLGVFLDNYGVKLTDDRLTFGADTELMRTDGGEADGAAREWREGPAACGGEPGELSLLEWDSVDRDDHGRFDTDMATAHVARDRMAWAVVFAAPGVDPGLPPSAAVLDELGAVDATSPASVVTPWDGSVKMVIYVNPGTTEPELADIRQRIVDRYGSLLPPSGIRYLDPTESLAQARLALAADPVTASLLTVEHVPTAFHLTPAGSITPDQLAGIADELGNLPNVLRVDVDPDMVPPVPAVSAPNFVCSSAPTSVAEAICTGTSA